MRTAERPLSATKEFLSRVPSTFCHNPTDTPEPHLTIHSQQSPTAGTHRDRQQITTMEAFYKQGDIAPPTPKPVPAPPPSTGGDGAVRAREFLEKRRKLRKVVAPANKWTTRKRTDRENEKHMGKFQQISKPMKAQCKAFVSTKAREPPRRRCPIGGVKEAELTHEAFEIEAVDGVYGNQALVAWGREMTPGKKWDGKITQTLEDFSRIEAIVKNPKLKLQMENAKYECDRQCRYCRERIEVEDREDTRQCRRCYLHTHIHCTAAHLGIDTALADVRTKGDAQGLTYLCQICIEQGY